MSNAISNHLMLRQIQKGKKRRGEKGDKHWRVSLYQQEVILLLVYLNSTKRKIRKSCHLLLKPYGYSITALKESEGQNI